MVGGLWAASAVLAEPELRDRVTPVELERIRAASPFDALVDAAARQARAAADPQVLDEGSEILHDGTRWTLAPKGAVLHVPPTHATRIGTAPSGRGTPWAEFLRANIAWLTTEEVTFAQAAGREALPEERTRAWTSGDKVVVATYQGGPISVRKPAASTDPEP